MKVKVLPAAIVAVMIFPQILQARSDDDMTLAERLYQKGLYSRALDMFQSIEPQDVMSRGYAVLCQEQLRTIGYEDAVQQYESLYGTVTVFAPQINALYARNLFADERYSEALARYDGVPEKSLSYRDYTELLFKKAYSHSAVGHDSEALSLYDEVIARGKSDFTAPSQYAAGYIVYSANDFARAERYFQKSVKDLRFKDQSEYYLLECRFLQHDYDYVMSNGERIYNDAPEQRQPHLARILSETYLVSGNVPKANAYFKLAERGEDSRADQFYAGSLQYALGNYKDAIASFSQMREYSDSIGQIAAYQMGYSYIQTKDKVSAMESFGHAAETSYSAEILEDATLNYAKLAFDLNHDSSPFVDYMQKYPDSGKNDMIYDYIAVASLYKRDYPAAIAAYDRIDDLSAHMRSNYMKANYLYAESLISSGAYSSAIDPLKAVTAYAGRNTNIGKTSRYWLAEASYRSGDYREAGSIFTDLYNNSALDTKQEGRLLPYNVAYCYFRSDDYSNAAKWFSKYISSGDGAAREDALLRKGDCYFITKDYKTAVEEYGQAISQIQNVNLIYPYYQQGLSYGFMGKTAQKAETLSKVIYSEPSAPFYSEAVYELGRAYVTLRKESDAINAFNTIIDRSPDSTYVAKSLIEIAMIDRNNKQYGAALDNYKKVVEQFGGSDSAEGAMLAIESIYQSLGEPEKYLEYTEQLGEPKHSEAEKDQVYFNSAEQIFMNENYDQAIVSLVKYLDAFPQGASVPQASYYLAECYRQTGETERAAEWYSKVISYDRDESYTEQSRAQYAAICYQLSRYDDAYAAYDALARLSHLPANVLAGQKGRMLSAYKAHKYEAAISSADVLIGTKGLTAADLRSARYTKAHALLSLSRRSEAYELFSTLAQSPSTSEGAEATYLLIQDIYDRGRFSEVEKKVYKFASEAGSQSYWLAKSYIVLGDSFVEMDNIKQARATFESVRSGYRSQGAGDDVLETVLSRLERLDSLTQ